MLASLLLIALTLSQVAPEAPLQEHEVARIDGVSVSANTYYHYLSLVYARLPEGDQALQQLLLEKVLEQRAAAEGVTVDEGEIDLVFAELDARAREATQGKQGLLDSVGGPDQAGELRRSVTLAALQRKLVAREQGLDDPEEVEDPMLQSWLDEAMATANLEEAPLDQEEAAHWSSGSLSRAEVGARIAQIISPDDRRGLLTELLGIHAIRRRAAVMGVELTPEAAADELLEREQQLAANPDAAGISYSDLVSQVFHRSITELVASPKFGAEVLLRQMVELNWDDAALASLFESERALFEERLGGPVTFEQARFAVIKEVRQRSYQQLLSSATIIRRF